ncbi:winged helix-turn-helix domain-containing protein [Micromonospora okii]|uniref:winged helix-turn-helix domain-containing protein n=1 Tax=Micromonospora okii TaxID=1182970 RepID=UPI001E43376A|nr:winged helix-turn-helix domain-containing protein [Micromonospora okii]
MSVVAISPRPHPANRADRARPGRADRPLAADGGPSPAPSRSASTLTVTIELTPGELSPGLTRLVELLRELAESGEGTLRAAPPQRPSAEHRPRPATAAPAAPRALAVAPRPEDPDEVRVLAASRVVRQGSRVIPLTRIEFDLLHFLAAHPRRVFTRLQLLSNVWGYEHAIARTVDVHVRRLRAKLSVANPVVTTVYGVGYRLADEARISVDPYR